MTAETRTATPGTRPWTPRIAVQLVVLASAAFIYVTAELLPVGLLSAIARNLNVSVVLVGTLLSWYALVALLTTIPLVRWTAHLPRRRVLVVSLACLTVSQLISALAPNFAVLAAGRVLCALTHGLLLSVIAPIATRLVPQSHAGRATTSIYVGSSLALVVGIPLTAAMSLMWGWRLAVVCVTIAAAVVTVGRVDPAARDGAQHGSARPRRPAVASSPEPAVDHRQRDHHDRRHRPLRLVHIHRGDHPRRRRRAWTEPGLAAGRVRRRGGTGGAPGGAAAGPPAPGRHSLLHGRAHGRVPAADAARIRRTPYRRRRRWSGLVRSCCGVPPRSV